MLRTSVRAARSSSVTPAGSAAANRRAQPACAPRRQLAPASAAAGPQVGPQVLPASSAAAPLAQLAADNSLGSDLPRRPAARRPCRHLRMTAIGAPPRASGVWVGVSLVEGGGKRGGSPGCAQRRCNTRSDAEAWENAHRPPGALVTTHAQTAPPVAAGRRGGGWPLLYWGRGNICYPVLSLNVFLLLCRVLFHPTELWKGGALRAHAPPACLRFRWCVCCWLPSRCTLVATSTTCPVRVLLKDRARVDGNGGEVASAVISGLISESCR